MKKIFSRIRDLWIAFWPTDKHPFEYRRSKEQEARIKKIESYCQKVDYVAKRIKKEFGSRETKNTREALLKSIICKEAEERRRELRELDKEISQFLEEVWCKPPHSWSFGEAAWYESIRRRESTI